MHPSSPATDPATPEQLAVIDAAISRLASTRGACLPMLHAIQEELGYVPHESIQRIADALNLSRADVHGVLTYYHDFRTAPPGRQVLKVCRAEACQAMGSDGLERHLRERHGVGMNETTADGEVTVEPVYCLGNCALSPSVLLDDEVHGRVTPERLDALLGRARSGDGRSEGQR
ncbi:MAG: formate dehydrogenase subunit gamma [Planctomycetes bacterium]|nr:formate dehydrogenase subunit gamma [Planctomycetota bacterium]